MTVRIRVTPFIHGVEDFLQYHARVIDGAILRLEANANDAQYFRGETIDTTEERARLVEAQAGIVACAGTAYEMGMSRILPIRERSLFRHAIGLVVQKQLEAASADMPPSVHNATPEQYVAAKAYLEARRDEELQA